MTSERLIVLEQTPAAKPAPEKGRLRSRLTPYLLIAPTLFFVVLFTIYPAVNTVVASLYEPARRAFDPPLYVGLENYMDLADSTHFLGSRFTQILSNTFIFAFATVGIGMVIALTLAILLNRTMRGLGIWRFFVVYPALLPTIGAASLWAFLYADTVGLINTVLRSFGLSTVNWLGDPDVVLFSVTLVNIWKQVGYFMIFYLAGLQNIPQNIYEAADLDGAGYFQKFFYITLPLLRRTTLFVSTIGFIFAFQTVEQLQVLNQGNPADRGNLLLYFIFQIIPERRNQGYVNAMTVILVAILLIFTITNFVLSERGGREDD
jgi:sn-glycerol 3-phosphate transport system permease protein